MTPGNNSRNWNILWIVLASKLQYCSTSFSGAFLNILLVWVTPGNNPRNWNIQLTQSASFLAPIDLLLVLLTPKNNLGFSIVCAHPETQVKSWDVSAKQLDILLWGHFYVPIVRVAVALIVRRLLVGCSGGSQEFLSNTRSSRRSANSVSFKQMQLLWLYFLGCRPSEDTQDLPSHWRPPRVLVQTLEEIFWLDLREASLHFARGLTS